MAYIDLYIFLGSFFLAILIGAFIPIPQAVGIWVLLIAGVLCVVKYVRRGVRVRVVVCALVAMAVAVIRLAQVPTTLPAVWIPLIDTKVVLEGTVVTLPDVRETSNRLIVEVAYEGATTRIIAAAPLYPRVHVGDRVEVTGKLSLPEPFEGDGGRVFRYDQFLRKDGVFALVQPAQVTVFGQSTNHWLRFMRILESGRTGFMDALMRALPEPESALAAGLIAGGKQGLGEELIDAFTIAGLLQIVVLSGYNVMVIANGIMRSLGFLPERPRALVACIAIGCFVLAAGAGSPALRAGLMALICILAGAFGAQYQVLRTLFITLFGIALWNPLMLAFDPGLQFSFLATLGLILGTPIIERKLAWIHFATLRELLASTLAAQAGVLPILLWQTGNLSLVAVVANIFVTPFIPIAMLLSALAALLSIPLSLVSATLPLMAGVPAYFFLTLIIKIAVLSAAVPFAQITVAEFPFWVVPVGYVALGWVVWRAYTTTPLPNGGGVVQSSMY